MGKGTKHVDQAVHDRARLPIVVAQEDREAAHPFDQRSDVRLAEFLAKLDQIAFPVSELLSVPNDVWTVQNA